MYDLMKILDLMNEIDPLHKMRSLFPPSSVPAMLYIPKNFLPLSSSLDMAKQFSTIQPIDYAMPKIHDPLAMLRPLLNSNAYRIIALAAPPTLMQDTFKIVIPPAIKSILMQIDPVFIEPVIREQMENKANVTEIVLKSPFNMRPVHFPTKPKQVEFLAKQLQKFPTQPVEEFAEELNACIENLEECLTRKNTYIGNGWPAKALWRKLRAFETSGVYNLLSEYGPYLTLGSMVSNVFNLALPQTADKLNLLTNFSVIFFAYISKRLSRKSKQR
jgi:hypothetical protein